MVASPSVSLLDALPTCLIWHILHLLDTCELGRVSCASSALRDLSYAVSPVKTSLRVTVLRRPEGRKALRERLRGTEELRLVNGRGMVSRHTGRFCRLHLETAPKLDACTSACGSLLDAGAELLLDAAPRLQKLDLTAMGHITAYSLLLALQKCPHLNSLCCRSCWRITKDLQQHIQSNVGSEKRSFSLVSLDVSHTDTVTSDLIALLGILPLLADLELNFCELLTDEVLITLPKSIVKVGVLGCCRLSYEALQALGKRVRIKSDDTIVEGAMRSHSCGPSAAMALRKMLCDYNWEANESYTVEFD